MINKNAFDFGIIVPIGLLYLSCLFSPLYSQDTTHSQSDVVVLGGSPSGLAAAIQAARLGSDVIVVEPFRHIGGMMSGGLTRTDIGDPSTTAGLVNEFYDRVDTYYQSKGIPHGYYHFEPHVAEFIWTEMVQESGNITVIVHAHLMDVGMNGESLTSIVVKKIGNNQLHKIEGKVFVDATYEGDLAAMSGAPFMLGREAKSEYNEPHGLDQADSLIQAYCYRLSVTQEPVNRTTITMPTGYDPKDYELLSEYVKTKGTTNFVTDLLYAREKVNGKADGNAQWRAWVSTDWAEINLDYPTGSYARRQEIYDEYKRLTLGWFYFIQNDPSIPLALRNDALTWGLSKDEFTDTENLPFMLYVREARRIMGQYVFKEQDATTNTIKSDAIGQGGYTIDSHHVINYDSSNIHLPIPIGNERYPVTKGYQIPYRILVPLNVKDLLVSLCVSSTHLGYSTLRMEPEYIKMGQAAGAAAHIAHTNNVEVADVNIGALQNALLNAGAKLGNNITDIKNENQNKTINPITYPISLFSSSNFETEKKISMNIIKAFNVLGKSLVKETGGLETKIKIPSGVIYIQEKPPSKE